MQIEQIGDSRYLLGESPVWDTKNNTLYWVDVIGQSIWRHRPGTEDYTQWKLPDMVSSLALKNGGNAIITLSNGFYDFNFDTDDCTLIGETIEADQPTRFNDGKVDRHGRFIAGTMDNTITKPIGSLYSLSKDKIVSKLDSDIICSNGPCWSLDGKTLYFTDTMRSTIFAYDYNSNDGTVGPRRVFSDLRKLGIQSAPDGCTVDSEGYLWSAQCLAGTIARIAPDGSLDRLIEMPVKYVTSVMFGGEKLDTLYVTSLNIPLLGNPPQEPNAGGLFAVNGLGFTGVPEPRYAG
ncbi:MAG: calcium-binding protein [Candidatus Hydrogenedentota bacterium]|nr:MAG: calcium-binding protein [Candidatus Hydrogenedentota bacterium]